MADFVDYEIWLGSFEGDKFVWKTIKKTLTRRINSIAIMLTSKKAIQQKNFRRSGLLLASTSSSDKAKSY